jgi:hypothetical protein
MTDLITEARELCAAATEGPWEVVGKDAWGIEGFPQVEMNTPDGKYFPVHNDTDAAFIARSRTLIPELCDALEKAQEQNKQLLHEVCKLACESVEREKNLARLEAEVMARLEEHHDAD